MSKSKPVEAGKLTPNEQLIVHATRTFGPAFMRRVFELADEVVAGDITTLEAAWILHAERGGTAPTPKERRGN